MKWATAANQKQVAAFALSHASRARFSYLFLSWGSASLHPRLYASTRFAGFGKLGRVDLFLSDNSLPVVRGL